MLSFDRGSKGQSRVMAGEDPHIPEGGPHSSGQGGAAAFPSRRGTSASPPASWEVLMESLRPGRWIQAREEPRRGDAGCVERGQQRGQWHCPLCHTEAAAALPWTSRRRAKRERPPGAVLKGLRGDGNRSDLRLQDW